MTKREAKAAAAAIWETVEEAVVTDCEGRPDDIEQVFAALADLAARRAKR